MEYAQYPQQQQNTHSGYPNPGASAGITSPTNHSISQHAVHSSPLLNSQQQQPQQQQQQSTQHQGHNMYQPQYGVPQQGMQQVPYGMPGIQAAAMAATAAASGSNYPYMHPGSRHASKFSEDGRGQERQPPVSQNERDAPNTRSADEPSHQPQCTKCSRHDEPRPTPRLLYRRKSLPARLCPIPNRPRCRLAGPEESPLYVNAKQFHRILKRRVARQRLEEQLRLTSKGRKPYLHESRHNHAMRRPRGPGGRFLTAEEVAAMERDAKGEDAGKTEGGDAVATKPADSAGTKRKSEAGSGSPNKKSKTSNRSPDEGEEDDG